MNPDRKSWNEKQQALRQALSHPTDLQTTVTLFLDQHAMVHSAEMSNSGLWSFEDEVWQGLNETTVRCIPRGCEHSIAWLIWHIARIEDVTMNLLVAGDPQVLDQGPWQEQMKILARDTGNAMSNTDLVQLSAAIELQALKAYRKAVGRRTREVIENLALADLNQKVAPARLQRLLEEGAVLPAASGLLDYWGGLKISGLLLMPPTRHNFLHLNEALRIKQKHH